VELIISISSCLTRSKERTPCWLLPPTSVRTKIFKEKMSIRVGKKQQKKPSTVYFTNTTREESLFFANPFQEARILAGLVAVLVSGEPVDVLSFWSPVSA
jgi:hypothetical protein